jgi:phosphatidylethanolamine/phosphatidyl-N-methylethanolamine N-methyltransferase
MPTDAVPADARRAFLAAFVRRPGTMGAVAPSSARLSAVLTSIVPTAGSPVVVELGPGTGAVSAAIDQRLPVGSRHLAVELDATMVEYLGRTRPGMEVVHGDARHLGKLLAERGVIHVDAVVCGLPWALFDELTQHAVLSEVGESIGRTGAFSTFAYLSGMALPAARRFRRTLQSRFEEVIVSSTVWRNMPPAFVYVCRRPTG